MNFSCKKFGKKKIFVYLFREIATVVVYILFDYQRYSC